MMRPEAETPLDADAVRDAHATLTRILGAIEEYVYTGEFLDDGGYRVVFAGPCREQFLGLTAAEARTAVWRYYVHPDDVEVFDVAHDRAHGTGRLDVDYRLVGADGVVRWVRDRGQMRVEDGRRFLDGSILDVTEVHAAQEALDAARAEADRLAHVDHLTGAANRRSLPRLLARHAGDALGLLSVDLDRFKQINDLYGHAAGDAVLVEVADRVRASVRGDDALVRMGGEEFLVLVGGVGDERDLAAIGEGIRRRIASAPVPVRDAVIDVTVSIGAALVAARGDDPERALIDADGALYEAKRAGRNRVRVGSLDAGEMRDERRGGHDSDTLRVARAMVVAAAATEGIDRAQLEQVGELAAEVAARLGCSPAEVMRCRVVGLLHDVGKLRVPAELLAKTGPLEDSEWALVKAHSVHGEALLREVPELRAFARAVRHHHERFDGQGYPDGLGGPDVPIEARVVAAAAAWTAMRRARPYRPALDEAAALRELDRVAGSQLDPRVVEALRGLIAASSAAT